MQYQIEKLLADKTIEKDGNDYFFRTTLKIGLAENKNGYLKVIESFELKNDIWAGTTADGETIDLESNFQIYSLG
jgi:hypothetical protein